MRKLASLLVIVSALFFLAGCSSLLPKTPAFLQEKSKPSLASSLPDTGSILPPGGILKPDAPVTRQDIKPESPARHAIQITVNWAACLFVLGGMAACAFGGLAIYGGQILPGVKLILAGLLLPIFGIWFAYHWLLVVIIALVSAAAFLLIQHWTQIAPLLARLESDIAPRLATLETKALAAVGDSPAPAPATTAALAANAVPAASPALANAVPAPAPAKA